MEMNFKTLALFCAVALSLTGCSKDTPAINDSTSSGSGSNELSAAANKTVPKNVVGADAYVESVSAPSSTDCKIEFSENSVSTEGGSVDVKGTTVTITNPGVYSVSGACSDGKIVVSAAKGNEVTLVLNGVDLKSRSNSVIECTSGKTLTLYAAEGTINTLSDAETYTFTDGGDEPDSAVFSKSDLIIAGSGKLTVNGSYKDGIKSKDTLSVNCGELCVNSADDGIVGKDYVVVQSGSITVKAGGDGIKSTNDTDTSLGYITINGGEFDIASDRDGIQAKTSLCVNGGNFKIVSGGKDADAEIKASAGSMFDRDHGFNRQGSTSTTSSDDSSSQKGIKAGGEIVIKNGELDIKAADDSIHSNGGVTVAGGKLTLSSCDDGIHADELLDISGGEVSVIKSYEGLEGKNIEISGGVIDVKAMDDGLNAAGGDGGSFFGFNSGDYYIKISGGDITVNAGGDGVDSNGTIAQSGGKLTVFGPTDSGNAAIDYEKSYAISGGTLIALGSSGMAQAPSTLSQPCLSINASVSANSTIEVRGKDGNVILSTTAVKQCQSLIFSCEEFKSGDTYSIYANGALLSEVTATEGIAGNGANQGFGGGGFGHGGFGGQGWNKGDNSDNGNSRPDGEFDPNNSDFHHGGKFDPNNSDFPQGGRFDPNNSDFPQGGKFDPNNSNFQPGGRGDTQIGSQNSQM